MKKTLTSFFMLAAVTAATAQPQLIKDIRPGSVGSTPMGLTGMNGKVYFSASKLDSLLPGTGNTENELWVTDGSNGGTFKVLDLLPGSQGGTLSPQSIINIGNKLFFSGHTNLYGRELWTSDGTEAGTKMVKNIYPYGEDARIGAIMSINGKAVFIARDSAGTGLFSSDGTEAGTFKMIATDAGSGFMNVITMGGNLYIQTHVGSRYGLFRTDGTTAGTSLLFTTASYWVSNMAVYNNEIYFIGDTANTGDNELWKTNGTLSGTQRVKDIRPGSQGSTDWSVALGANSTGVYFFADDGVNGRELWKSNGTSGGTTMLKEFTSGSAGSTPATGPMLTIGDQVIFAVQHASGWPNYLCGTDGTSAGTVVLIDSCSGPMLYAQNYTYAGDKILLSEGPEVYATNGTPSGTSVVANSSNEIFFINTLMYYDDFVYCTVYDTAYGEELFRFPYQAASSGIMERVSLRPAKVYPNPASDLIHISVEGEIIQTLDVSDISGKRLMHFDTLPDHAAIDVSVLNKGIYFYHITTRSGVLYSGKFIINQQ